MNPAPYLPGPRARGKREEEGMAGYAVPEVLVDTAWVEEHKNDPRVRVVEVDVDTSGYDQGHVPGAIAWNWTTQLCDTLRRDIIPKDQFERLVAASRGGH